MVTKRDCQQTSCKTQEGNCPVLGLDSLPAQCVGSWAEDKYYFLERYLNASCEARRKFSDKGNAVFIDLFAGPGACVVKDENREITSGGLRALSRDEAGFNECFIVDKSTDNIQAFKKRISKHSKATCSFWPTDANVCVQEIVRELNKQNYRYHFAFVDPFGPEALKFETVRMLAGLRRMDMLIHFPIGAIKRNLDVWKKRKDGTILDNFLGTTAWRDRLRDVSGKQVYNILVDVYKEQLKSVGYPDEGLKLAASNTDTFHGLPAVPVKNTKNVDLYVLLLISKHALGQKIWTSIIKKSPDGQKDLF